MSKRPQHRPPRETISKEYAHLKQENKALKRKVAALRKQLDQNLSTVDVDEPDVVVETPVAKKPGCPKCGSADLMSLTTPRGKAIKFCRACKARHDAS